MALSEYSLVLNAFRHHRNSHNRAVASRPRPSCAQRLLALSDFSLMLQFFFFFICCLLNPFRHHRNSHQTPYSSPIFFNLCSTPFGIIGILTRLAGGVLLLKVSAQRLSASSEFSRCGG